MSRGVLLPKLCVCEGRGVGRGVGRSVGVSVRLVCPTNISRPRHVKRSTRAAQAPSAKLTRWS